MKVANVPHLLVAMGPDQRHPVKAGASRAPASRLAALTGCRRPGSLPPIGYRVAAAEQRGAKVAERESA